MVARPLLPPPRHRLRRPHHQPKKRHRRLPVPCTRRRNPNHTRRVVEQERGRRGERRAPDRHGPGRVRRAHHQRHAGRPDFLRRRRRVRTGGGVQPDVPPPHHQRRSQCRALLQGVRPQLHRRRRRRQLHRAVCYRRHCDSAWADGGRAHDRLGAARPVLHGGQRVREQDRPDRVQHRHRHRRRRVQGSAERHRALHAGHAGSHRRGHRRHLLLVSQRPRPADRPALADDGRPPHAGGVRGGPGAVRAGPDEVPGVRAGGVHEQALIPVPQEHLSPAGVLRRRLRRVHGGLPELPAAGAGDHEDHVGEEGQLQRRGGGGAAERGVQQLPGHGEPPDPPPRVQLLRAGAGARHLRPQRRLQPREPAGAQHRHRARRRLDGDTVRGEQSRYVVHALSLGRAPAVGAGNGVQGAQWPDPEYPSSASRGLSQVLLKQHRPAYCLHT